MRTISVCSGKLVEHVAETPGQKFISRLGMHADVMILGFERDERRMAMLG